MFSQRGERWSREAGRRLGQPQLGTRASGDRSIHRGCVRESPGKRCKYGSGLAEVLAGGRIPKHRIANEEDRMGGIPMSLV